MPCILVLKSSTCDKLSRVGADGLIRQLLIRGLIGNPANLEDLDRITLDPAVMGGRACIRGLRVTVGTVIGFLAAGRSRDEILEAYPYLEAEDIDQSLAYAAWRVEEREVSLPDV